ncbi:MAG: hypothetical protein QM729_21245 [Solirubrobacterales bacterium]
MAELAEAREVASNALEAQQMLRERLAKLEAHRCNAHESEAYKVLQQQFDQLSDSMKWTSRREKALEARAESAEKTCDAWMVDCLKAESERDAISTVAVERLVALESAEKACLALREAAANFFASVTGQKKACGHDFECVCPGDLLRAALAATPQDLAERYVSREQYERETAFAVKQLDAAIAERDDVIALNEACNRKLDQNDVMIESLIAERDAARASLEASQAAEARAWAERDARLTYKEFEAAVELWNDGYAEDSAFDEVVAARKGER